MAIKTWYIGEQFEVKEMSLKAGQKEFETEYYLGDDNGYQQSAFTFTFLNTGEITIIGEREGQFIYLNKKEVEFLKEQLKLI